MKPTLLVTGSAGFIGNAACEYYRDRYDVVAVDDLSRETSKPPKYYDCFYHGDAGSWTGLMESADAVLHLAAQVSVMASYSDPQDDFRRNAGLTLKLARAASWSKTVKTFIYASTNKVFGECAGMMWYPTLDTDPINPQTPYGISKATGGLYVREFLPETGYVFHQSCICGETQDQHATEDQGWVGFLRRQIRDGKPITCYGDGSQVRDLLHVNDLLRAYDLVLDGKLDAGSYVVGGGLSNAVSFKEAVKLLGGEIAEYKGWRPHDQRYFVSGNEGLCAAGWRPWTSAREWLRSQRKEAAVA